MLSCSLENSVASFVSCSASMEIPGCKEYFSFQAVFFSAPLSKNEAEGEALSLNSKLATASVKFLKGVRLNCGLHPFFLLLISFAVNLITIFSLIGNSEGSCLKRCFHRTKVRFMNLCDKKHLNCGFG